MSDTTTVRLPTDLTGLKRLLPAEPRDTTATRWRQAMARLDELVTLTHGQLEEADRNDRQLAADLVDRAAEGTSLEPLSKLDTVVKAGLEHRLAVLRLARDMAGSRFTNAHRDDPALNQWRRRCAEITAEWQNIVGIEDEQARFNRLADFADRHGR